VASEELVGLPGGRQDGRRQAVTVERLVLENSYLLFEREGNVLKQSAADCNKLHMILRDRNAKIHTLTTNLQRAEKVNKTE
jgi:hypothetical protein